MINAQDFSGSTPFHVAVDSANLPACEVLLDRSDLNLQTNSGESPLHLAVRQRYSETSGKIVQMLREKKVNLNLVDRDGFTALELAENGGKRELALSIALDTDIKREADRLEAKLKRDESAKEKGWNLLHYAIHLGRLTIVRFLCLNERFILTPDKEGNTPLHLFAQRGDIVFVTLLIEKGAKLEVTNKEGNTPLHLAARSGNPLVIRELVKAGAKLDAKNKEENTPLHLAAEAGNLECVQTLEELAQKGM